MRVCGVFSSLKTANAGKRTATNRAVSGRNRAASRTSIGEARARRGGKENRNVLGAAT